MQLKDIMAKDVKTIGSNETITAASCMMKEADVGCLVVTNSGSVAGIITDRDLVVGCLSEGHDSQKCQVSQHMTEPTIIAEPSMDIFEGAHLMSEQRIKRLPIVDDNQLVGLTSFSDIGQAMDKTMHELLLGMGAARAA